MPEEFFFAIYKYVRILRQRRRSDNTQLKLDLQAIFRCELDLLPSGGWIWRMNEQKPNELERPGTSQCRLIRVLVCF